MSLEILIRRRAQVTLSPKHEFDSKLAFDSILKIFQDRQSRSCILSMQASRGLSQHGPTRWRRLQRVSTPTTWCARNCHKCCLTYSFAAHWLQIVDIKYQQFGKQVPHLASCLAAPQNSDCAVNRLNRCSSTDKCLEQITLGEEGFFAQGSPYTRYNPFGTPGNVLPGWSERIGQVSSSPDFLAQPAIASLLASHQKLASNFICLMVPEDDC